MSERPSALKLAANRKNAQKSTGPRTLEGKQRCAQNAVRHGLWSRSVVVQGGERPERRADFEALHAELREGVAPRDAVEEALVARIATCLWRLRRAQSYETAAIHTAIEAQASPASDAYGRPVELRRAQAHDEQIDSLKKRLGNLRGDLAAKGRLLAMLRHPDSTKVKYVDQMDHLRFGYAIKEAAGQCDPPILELTDPAALAKAIELASDEVDSLRLEVARCETLLRDAIDWQCDAAGVEFGDANEPCDDSGVEVDEAMDPAEGEAPAESEHAHASVGMPPGDEPPCDAAALPPPLPRGDEGGSDSASADPSRAMATLAWPCTDSGDPSQVQQQRLPKASVGTNPPLAHDHEMVACSRDTIVTDVICGPADEVPEPEHGHAGVDHVTLRGDSPDGEARAEACDGDALAASGCEDPPVSPPATADLRLGKGGGGSRDARDPRRDMAAALPSEAKLARLIRYESMLDRELHRALSELRRRRAADDHDSRGSALDRTGRRDQAGPGPDAGRQSDHAHASVGMPPDRAATVRSKTRCGGERLPRSPQEGEVPAEADGVEDSAHPPTARAKRADFRVSPDAFCPVRPRWGLRKGEWDAL